ncbi:MAG: family 43 glycosylhydrolase [Bacteroidaceae bacterium]|nr:family 43 glycosylhydrolase [Bacteroidaceae bacterium]
MCIRRAFALSTLLCASLVAQAQTPWQRTDDLPANPFGQALVPDMIADASIQHVDGTFYCYATTDGYGRHLDTSGPPVVWKSKDFVHWSFEGTYFPSAATQKYWAPSKVVRENGKYYIYPTINGFMYAAESESMDGPFRLSVGPDRFNLPWTAATLIPEWPGHEPWGIDAELFRDDDGQWYCYWQHRSVAKMLPDMTHIDTTTIDHIRTPQTQYSEGPIFFKRKGIYYYLFTIGGDERYEYAYVMSRESPLGPWAWPEHNVITTTDYETGCYGPGHGSVFNVEGTDDWYIAYLEFGRRSTNRMTYVSRLEFNDDGTIRPVKCHLNGVGALGKSAKLPPYLRPSCCRASSVCDVLYVKPNQDQRLNRYEHFDAAYAIDGSNGSRWMPDPKDLACWIEMDLGEVKAVKGSEIFFVRPTAGHAYRLEASTDGVHWKPCGGHQDLQMRSPHCDRVKTKARYLRVTITGGEPGVYEWNVW